MNTTTYPLTPQGLRAAIQDAPAFSDRAVKRIPPAKSDRHAPAAAMRPNGDLDTLDNVFGTVTFTAQTPTALKSARYTLHFYKERLTEFADAFPFSTLTRPLRAKPPVPSARPSSKPSQADIEDLLHEFLKTDDLESALSLHALAPNTLQARDGSLLTRVRPIPPATLSVPPFELLQALQASFLPPARWEAAIVDRASRAILIRRPTLAVAIKDLKAKATPEAIQRALARL